jgi:ribokinase
LENATHVIGLLRRCRGEAMEVSAMHAPDPAAVAVVGSVNVDHLISVSRLPAAGETLSADGYQVAGGGKGANQALAAAALGARTYLVAAVGDDPAGAGALRELALGGVDSSFVVTADCASGAAFVTVDAAARNSIVVVAGANARLPAQHVRMSLRELAQRETRLVVVANLEVPDAAVEAAMLGAREVGATTILNPAPFRELDRALLGQLDLLVPNETEARSLLEGLAPADDDPEDLARSLRTRLGQQPALVLTLGERGCIVAVGTAITSLPADRVTTRNTAGAGDAFIGGLAAGLAGGLPLLDAARLARDAGTVAVQTPTARVSVEDLVALRERLHRRGA